MTKYTSHYPSLMFYVDGELKRFNNGVYTTSNALEIEVLDALIDVRKEVEVAPVIQSEEKTEAKPKAPRKASTK